MADYGGLDPGVVNYLQGGGMPSGTIAPPPITPDAYGLPPQVVAGVQNGFAPQQLSTPEYALPGAIVQPPPPPPQRIGVNGGTGVDETSGAPDVPVPSVTGGQLQPSVLPPELQSSPQPIAAPAPAPMQGGADYVIGTAPAALPTTPAEVAKSNAVVAKTQAANAAFQASPEGIAQRADNEQRAAIDKERQAAADTSAVERAQADATVAALHASAERQAKDEAINAAKRAQDNANTDKYTQLYAQQVKDAADYKVDTDRSVGTSGLIAIALSGIGQALDHNHGPNTALQIIDADIDKRISDQWAQKKALGEKADSTRGVLDMYRRNADDDRQAMQFQKAAEQTRTADDIRLRVAQMANPAAKARGEEIAAGLDQKASAITMSEAQRKVAAERAAQEQANERARIGVSYADLAEKKQEHKDALEQHKDDIAKDLVIAQEHAKGAKAAQALNAFNVPDSTLNPDGSQRPDVALKNPPTADNPDGEPVQVREKLQEDFAKRIPGYDKAINAVDILREHRSDNGGDVLNSSEAREKLQEFERTAAGVLEAGGTARISGEILEHAKAQISGGADPTSVLRSVMPALNQFRKDVEFDRDKLVRSHTTYVGPQLHIPDPLSVPKATRTPDEDQLDAVLKRPTLAQYGAETGNDFESAWKSGDIGIDEAMRRRGVLDQSFDSNKVILPSQKSTIDNFASVLDDPNATLEAKKKAAAFLDRTAESAQSPAIKAYALSVQTQAAVNARTRSPEAEDPSISSGSGVRDTSYGGTAQTASAQHMLELAPIDALAQQAQVAPKGSAERRDAQREIMRRADAGDQQAMAARVAITQNGGR